MAIKVIMSNLKPICRINAKLQLTTGLLTV